MDWQAGKSSLCTKHIARGHMNGVALPDEIGKQFPMGDEMPHPAAKFPRQEEGAHVYVGREMIEPRGLEIRAQEGKRRVPSSLNAFKTNPKRKRELGVLGRHPRLRSG
jgi:hypothetical protein